MTLLKEMNVSFVAAAIKAKAPIVAVPVEGNAPICIRRSKLAAWAKGMKISRVTVQKNPDLEGFEHPKRIWDENHRIFQRVLPEGPCNRTITPGERRLVIEAHPVKSPSIRSRCTIIPVPRREALKEIGIWSEKERERIQKRILLGALDKSQRKAFKRAAFEDNTDTMIPVMVSSEAGKPKQEKMGFPVSLPEMPDMSFALVKFGSVDAGDIQWSVTERITGKRAGSGKTAENALLDARMNAKKASAASLANIRREVASALAEIPQQKEVA
jgi:hypothetical protein